jgi:hypothetical protein
MGDSPLIPYKTPAHQSGPRTSLQRSIKAESVCGNIITDGDSHLQYVQNYSGCPTY